MYAALFPGRNAIVVLALIACAAAVTVRDAAAAAQKPIEVPDQDLKELAARLIAPKNLYPSIVALAIKGSASGFFCTGILIKPEWVVTTGHCTKNSMTGRDGAKVEILYGDTDLKQSKKATVEKIVVHESYSAANNTNDISLLKLESPIPVPGMEIGDNVVVPASTAPQNADDVQPGSFVVAGWGGFTEGFRSADTLQRHLTVRLVPKQDCNGAQGYNGAVKEDQICAASIFAGVDACQGFSGAPLMFPTGKGAFKARGFVTWGVGCARPDKPTVYTSLTYHKAWIDKVTGVPQAQQVALRQAPVDPFTQAAPSGRVAGPRVNVAPRGIYRNIVSISRASEDPLVGHFCGGVLLSRTWVVTAAHCVQSARPEALRLVVDTETLSTATVFLTAVEIIRHPKSETTAFNNPIHDVALIRIEGRVPSDIEPAELLPLNVERQALRDGAGGMVLGWGKNASSRFAQMSNYLSMIALNLVSNETCNGRDVYSGLIDENVFCAGQKDVDACQGDSGGPFLVYQPGKSYLLAGLVSWGDGCGETKGRPGVYVRISHYLDWMKQEMDRAPR